jgi:hypothetical protein
MGIRVTTSLASAGMLHWRGSVEVSSSQMKNRFFFTRNGLFIFSHQQWHSSFHSSRVVQDPRHFFWRITFLRTSLWHLSWPHLAQHPDARWLTEACAGKDVTTKEDAEAIFSALGQNDARALCFFVVVW